MALFNAPIPQEKKSAIQDKNVAISWDVVDGGIAELESDTRVKGVGINSLLYVKKFQGCSEYLPISGVTGRCKGSFSYVDPDVESTGSKRFHLVFAYNNAFYAMYDGAVHFLRDTSTSDSLNLNHLDGEQLGRFAYFAVNNTGTSAKAYRYDGNITASVAVSDAGGGKLQLDFTNIVPNIQTTLVVGNTVVISGTSDYAGTYTVDTVNSATSVDVVGTYVSDQSGTAEMFTMKYVDETAQDAASLYGYLDDSLVAVGIGPNAKQVQVSINDVSGQITSFAISNDYGEGFSIYGLQREVVATAFISGYLCLSEPNRITFHSRKAASYDSAGIEQQQTRTIEDALTASGIGTRSKNGMVVGDNNILYIADEDSKAIWAYRVGSRPDIKNISESFTPTLRNYDLTNAEMIYDRSRNYVICRCSSIPGGFPDISLVYNPRTGSWGIDSGKQANNMAYDPINKKLYAFDISTPRILEIWDDSYSNLGQKTRLLLRTRPINAGDDYVQKEYDSSSIKFGALSNTQGVVVSYFVDEESSADTSEEIDFSSLTFTNDSLAAAWGQYASGSGGGLVDRKMEFKRYLNEDSVSDFSRLTIQIEEESYAPFLVYQPKLVIIPTDDQSNDFD